VGLGTDGAASNNCLSIFQEMKAAALGQKSFYQNPEAINADTVWRMGTEYGANISGFPVGKIEPNLGADFVVIDLNDLALFPEKQLKSHLVYTLPERSISYVYVAGKPILAHGRFTQIDPVEVKTNINELTKNW
jgi:5-methylthioadenosine/S-adenosylhomocysteine deaminase